MTIFQHHGDPSMWFAAIIIVYSLVLQATLFLAALFLPSSQCWAANSCNLQMSALLHWWESLYRQYDLKAQLQQRTLCLHQKPEQFFTRHCVGDCCTGTTTQHDKFWGAYHLSKMMSWNILKEPFHSSCSYVGSVLAVQMFSYTLPYWNSQVW